MARRQLETVRVSGGDYTGVGERVLSFREDHPNSKIVTKLIESTDGEVILSRHYNCLLVFQSCLNTQPLN